jgi:hypothetical protein
MSASDVHREILKKAVPYIEELCKTKNDNISEGDIVGTLQKSFQQSHFSGLTLKLNQEGLLDLVIYKNDAPFIVYEVKTYFKDNERFCISTAEGAIKNDLKKLAKRENDAAGYFLMVCKKETFERDKEDCSLKFITEKKEQGAKYEMCVYQKDITVIVKHKEVTDNFYIFSWFVEKL